MHHLLKYTMEFPLLAAIPAFSLPILPGFELPLPPSLSSMPILLPDHAFPALSEESL